MTEAKKPPGCLGSLLQLAFALACCSVVIYFMAMREWNRPVELARRPAASTAQVQAIPAWSYSADEDALGGRSRSATIQSSNTLEFGFPYQGAQPLTLTLRSHSKHGNDVILSVARGQFQCGVSKCSVAVRFDQGAQQTFTAVGPADHGSTTLFLLNYDKFYSQLLKAKRIAIAPTFFQNGAPIMVFDVAGFDTAAYSGKAKK